MVGINNKNPRDEKIISSNLDKKHDDVDDDSAGLRVVYCIAQLKVH